MKRLIYTLITAAIVYQSACVDVLVAVPDNVNVNLTVVQ